MWQPQGRRSNIEIIADILGLLRLGETGDIEVAAVTHVTREQASRYMASLVEADLLESTEQEIGLPSFRITRKGLQLLTVIENMREMLPPDGVVDFLHRSKVFEVDLPSERAPEPFDIDER